MAPVIEGKASCGMEIIFWSLTAISVITWHMPDKFYLPEWRHLTVKFMVLILRFVSFFFIVLDPKNFSGKANRGCFNNYANTKLFNILLGWCLVFKRGTASVVKTLVIRECFEMKYRKSIKLCKFMFSTMLNICDEIGCSFSFRLQRDNITVELPDMLLTIQLFLFVKVFLEESRFP